MATADAAPYRYMVPELYDPPLGLPGSNDPPLGESAAVIEVETLLGR